MAENDPNQPKRIKPLDPQLVNRIAAGEIIQRPFNALKEMVENCLDAGATSINIQIKEGGLKLIQIQDNGCGIDKDDLKIICERFTTSKLKEFEDLRSINTFGFRGEALASISHVSRLTIVTRTAHSPCAFKATYTDGKLTAEGIKPCASASKGTQISVDDLFYNSSIRRNALRNSSEEFAKIYDMVARYAIQNYHVSFVLKRAGESALDLKTFGCQQATGQARCEANESYLLDNIGLVFGAELRKELDRIALAWDDNYKFEMNGYISNAKCTSAPHQLKQHSVFILFINERLVDCQPIKKCLQNVFSTYLPKNANSFVFINLRMHPQNLDVNIHPTKHEVRFLYQDEIINKIQVCVEQKMLDSNVSRTYYMKNLTLDTFVDLTNSNSNLNKTSDQSDAADKTRGGSRENRLDPPLDKTSKPGGDQSTIVYPYQLTRVDSRERKLDSFLHSTALNESIKQCKENSQRLDESSIRSVTTKASTSVVVDDLSKELRSPLRFQKLPRAFTFKSLSALKDSVEKNASPKTKAKLSDMNFVGCLDREMALVQHRTGLYIANTRVMSEELFYQLSLFNFGNFGYFRLQKPLPLQELVLVGLEDPDTGWSPEDGSKEKLARRCAKLLYTKAAMLDDYFSIKLSRERDQETGQDVIYIETLPMLMEDHEPDLYELPVFVIRLATEVEWAEEKECFDSISRELALFYSIKTPKQPQQQQQASAELSASQDDATKPQENWFIEHVMYNAFRNMLLSSVDHEQQIFFKLVDLSKLYRVFERC